MSCRTRLMAVAGTIAVFAHPAAASTQCLQQVDEMATALDMTTTLPEPSDLAPSDLAQSDGAEAPDVGAVSALAESGGVIAPPDGGMAGDMPVIEPSAGQPDDMATAPDIEPEGSSGTDMSALEEAAARTQIEALLTAARQAAEAAQEDVCLARLQEATALAAANRLLPPEE